MQAKRGMATTHPAESVPVYAGAIVVARDGRILCQLRDDKSDIPFPGYWTCSPGGHVESGEPLHEAIVRELKEEFEIDVDHLKPLITHRQAEGEYRGVYHAFTASLGTPMNKVQCNEGQKADFFHPDEIRNLRVHPISLLFLERYLETAGSKTG